MNKVKGNIILGIDPGTLIMGYGIIRISGNDLHLLEMGTLKLKQITDAYEKLQRIHEKITDLIRGYSPQDFAIEAPFYGKNVQSMLKLGRAQGVAIAAAMHSGLNICEYSPRKIKQSITGNGNAGKEQVWQMLEKMLHFHEKPRYFDASDAVAVAVCHHFQQAIPHFGRTDSPKNWKEFVSRYPEKIVSVPQVSSVHTS